jgi:ligand-binding sensor domain-containing protein
VFLSTNKGISWNAVNTGLGTYPLATCFALSPDSIGRLFVGTYDGVFHTTNNGESWHSNGLTNVTSLVLTSDSLYSLVVGTVNGTFTFQTWNGNWGQDLVGLNHVSTLAVNGSIVFAGTFGGLFLSTYHGFGWLPDSGMINVDIRALAVDDGSILAGTHGGGIFVTTNNGGEWAPISSGLTNLNILALALITSESGIKMIAAGTEGGVFLSTDSGASWSFSGLGTRRVNAIVGINN